MIEFHGWIVIRESYSEESDGCFDINNILKGLEVVLKLLSSDIEFVIRSKNGMFQLSLFGFLNHKNESFDDLIFVINWIANNAIGSYGLIYVHDDEDDENNQQFLIYYLKKGKIFQTKDIYFSPVNPEIEE